MASTANPSAATVRAPDVSAERFRSVTQSVNDAIISADAAGRIVFWNDSARTIFGYEWKEVEGRPLTMLMPERYRALHQAGLARVRGGGDPHVIGQSTVPLEGIRSDGTEFPLELSLGEWQHDGQPFYTGVIRDVTERRRSDQYLAAQHAVVDVLARNPATDDALPLVLAALGASMGWDAGGFWLPAADGAHLRCAAYWHADGLDDAAFERVTREISFAPGEGMPGRVWASGRPAWVLNIADDDNFPRADAASEADLHGAIALPLVSDDETVGAVDFFSSRMRPPDEALLEMMSTVSTQVGQFIRRKQAEDGLLRATAQLEERAAALERSNAELEQFAYIASHDLSEPLRMVSGFVQLLSDRYQGQLDDDADEFIGFAVDGVQRMQSLIDDLLAYSRVGRTSREDGPADAGVALAAAQRSLAAAIAERNAVIEAGDLPVVLGDERELAQLFQNLISNAIKFCEEPVPRVVVEAEPDGARWRFRVRDNGIGIEPQHAERIFKMFQRLHDRDSYPGTGIGLSVCKKIVERQGGEVSVRPGDGGGTVFEFSFPAAPAEESR